MPSLRAASEFFGRGAELAVLRETAELLLRGMPGSIRVVGIPGIGKTELLRQAAARCADPGRQLVTAYLSPRGGRPGGVVELARQLMWAAGRGSGETVSDPPEEDEWIRRQPGAAGAVLRRLVRTETSGDAGAALAVLAELAQEAARAGRIHLMVFLDDLDLLQGPAGRQGFPAPGGDLVAWVITGSSEKLAPNRLVDGQRTIDVGPLAEEDAEAVLTLAMRRAGIALSPECRPAVALLGGIPLLAWQAAAAARLAGVSAFDSVQAFTRFCSGEMTTGFLAEYCRDWLAGGLPAGLSRSVLETMLHLYGRPGSPAGRHLLSREMLKEEKEVGQAVDELASRGLVTEHWGVVSPAAPLLLADFCRDQFRRHLEGCSLEESRARLTLEYRRTLEGGLAGRSARRNIQEMRSFIGAWDGQVLPKSLFDYGRFRQLFPEGSPDKARLEASDRSRQVMPRIVGVWSEDYRGGEQIPPYRLDLLAAAEPEQAGVERWLATDLHLTEVEVTSDMVKDFDRRMRLFQNRAGLGKASVTGWVQSGAGFSVEALELIARQRFWSSGPEQLKLMASLCGYPRTMQLVLPSPAAADETYSLKLVIPARADIELVAAGALERLSERIPLDGASVGKVKMALVEACINAFEHGRSEDKNVSLTFRVGPTSLEIEVFNRGIPFVPPQIGRPVMEEKFGAVRKRGWGLSLIRDLMDDLEFVEQEDGTLLRMTKYFQPARREGQP